MPTPDESRDEALKRLDKRLGAFETGRERKASFTAQRAMGQGYRFLAEVVGGVFGGAGFGWLFDHFAGTTPLGLVAGLLLGTGFSIYVAVQGAARWSKTESDKAGPLPSVPDDDDND
ncbi:AtpZ/AtpI family protein [Phenylobacterium sp.]|nr:AtpZ/AtpI family protein [Phenylobacterium sp.]MDP3658769.1 AtpZ/AtpI family protein [Phenylobacterium sp.]